MIDAGMALTIVLGSVWFMAWLIRGLLRAALGGPRRNRYTPAWKRILRRGGWHPDNRHGWDHHVASMDERDVTATHQNMLDNRRAK